MTRPWQRKPVDSRSADGPTDALATARDALSEAREAVATAERALGQVEGEGGREAPDPSDQAPEPTWRERLWRGPTETRIGVSELVEALGVSESWIYSRTRSDADPRLPHSKLGGNLVFKVGEVRAWVRDHEQVVEAYRTEPAKGELRVEAGGAG